MLKQIAWNTFKNTGNINTMIEIIKTDEELKNRQNNSQMTNNQLQSNNSQPKQQRRTNQWE